jgi:hypothetical protein
MQGTHLLLDGVGADLWGLGCNRAQRLQAHSATRGAGNTAHLQLQKVSAFMLRYILRVGTGKLRLYLAQGGCAHGAAQCGGHFVL